MERRVRIHKPDGLSFQGTTHGEEGVSSEIVVFDTVELSSGPNNDAEVFIVDPNETEISVIGAPKGGFQKVEVCLGEETRILYMAVNSD